MKLLTTSGRLLPQENVSEGVPSFPVKLIFLEDAVSQEINETFTLHLSVTPTSALGSNTMLLSNLTGVILDADGKFS